MAELFDSYSSDFSQLITSITAKLRDDLPSQSGETAKSTMRRAEMEIEEAEEIISQMEIEVGGFPQSVRSRYAVRLRGHKGELDKVKKDLRSTSTSNSSYNPALDQSSSGNLESSAADDAQRQRLLKGTATLEDGSRRLQESNRLALETEDLGADILRDLRGQREQIENSRNTLQQADSNIDRSSRTLNQMIRRARQQKLVTIGIITVLVLLILLILYSKFS